MLILCLLLNVVVAFEEILHRRFEYKHSFKGPSLTDSAGKVPFWNAGGSCMPSADSVRVTPSIRSKQGWIWNNIQYVGSNWEIEFSLKIHGRGKIGADGMAIWFVQEAPAQGGSVFGAPNNWKGLGVFFDSFDNDNKHDNPAVSAVVNDGSIAFDHGKDGKGQTVGSCVSGFRNRPHPTQVRLRYFNNILSLELNNGITLRDGDFETCFTASNVKIPPGGFFGVSAATGALADDHDITRFMVYSIFEKQDEAKPLSDEVKAKILSDYEKYDKDLEEKKKKFKEKNSSGRPPEEVEDEQNLFYKSLIDYQVKLADRFEMLSAEVKKLEPNNQGDISTLKSSVANIEKQQSSILKQLSENSLDTTLAEISKLQTKSANLEKDLKTISLALSSTQGLLKELSSRKTPACPALPSSTGISLVHLMCVLVIQTTLIIGYWVWRHRAEDARKKFF